MSMGHTNTDAFLAFKIQLKIKIYLCKTMKLTYLLPIKTNEHELKQVILELTGSYWINLKRK